jgi:hypothetical protein
LLGFQSSRLDIRRKKVIIGGQVYIRDYDDRKKSRRFSTYILPNTSIECVEYYQEIIDRIRHVFYLLIYAYLSQMVNLGQPFILPMVPAENSTAKNKLETIIVNYNSSPIFGIPIQLGFTEKLSAKIIDTMRKEQIFRLRRDIFDYRKKQSNKKRK